MIDLNHLKFTAETTRAKHGGNCAILVASGDVLDLLDMLEAAKLDVERIEFLQDATLDIRCVEQGEDSYGWQVIEHHMGTPREKVIGGSFDELGLREAIDAAMAATKGEQE